MKESKKLQTFLTVLIVLTVIFIWGNSILPVSLSSLFSGKVTETLVGNENAEGLIRKLAHFSEFLVLGGELTLLFSMRRKPRKETLSTLVCFAMFFPLIDETIQFFNDRAPMVQDIWIDIAGYTTGCLLALLLWWVVKKFRRKNQ